MPVKTVLAPLFDAQGTSAVLGSAFAVARAFNAHVNALHVKPDPAESISDFAGETVSPALVEEVLQKAAERADGIAARTRKAFETAASKAKIQISANTASTRPTASYLEEEGQIDYRIERHSRVNDLTVIRRSRNDADVAPRVAVETALMGSGRSVLIAPNKAPAKIGNAVAIAWNGSAEAARAVDAGLPFLTGARKVTVLCAREGDVEGFNQEGLLQYLRWHKVRAEAKEVKVGSAGAGRALMNAASRAGADLVVMGAYTHSRVREMVFGGVTSHVLSSTRLPVLMAH